MASTSSSSSSSSSVVPTRRKGGSTYDVFLLHHHHHHLQKGIHTFKDDEMLGGGQPISQELVKAIKESRFAVVVFSKNYADSSWCLEELSNIMERHKQMGGQIKVLPVFYHVDPSDVRGQKRDFATAFETHEDRFKGEMDRVNKWREALTAAANLSGQHILPDYGGEATFISKIVEEILADIQPRGGSRDNHLIGIQPRIDALISLLKMEATEEVRIVGICGMGGIGKTTIARALFKRIAHKFQGSSFVTNVRENSSSKKDICALQHKILQDILGSSSGVGIHDPEDGGEVIEERCCRKKVLLVLDDVNDAEQLEFLAATREWFGPGSRIIITTRDQHLLSYADETYKPAILSGDRAVELFSRNAFNKRSPPEGYEELSIRAMHHAGGLPLALKVLGSFFRGRKANVWESALKRLAKTQDDKIFNTLKLSYDDLCVSDQKIFLDIACFYKGKDVDEVTRILDCCGFDPGIRISVLVEKSLITISSNNRLEMHDLIQEMGRRVVKESAPNSRLWEPEKIHDLIGIEPRIDVLISLLKMEATEEVRIVGICGMGGIGKTTIARALFERIAHKFQGSSFVTDVRVNSSTKAGMCTLQERILNNILGDRHGYKIEDRDQGAKIIQESCCRKKVLLVLDDVNDIDQLKFLAATREWFGPGSRITITTRDQHLLSYANANDRYKPARLRTDQALELFSRHAFRKSSPPDGFMDLTNRAINYTHHLPLALKVLGSFLYGREASVWESALDTLAKTPNAEVLDTLKLSFDYLNVFEKQIFLDIACFYKGKDIDYVTRKLDSFGFNPVIGISVLVEKSLITISSDNTVDMHDLIQEMGWKVVQATAPNSRLREHEKIVQEILADKKPRGGSRENHLIGIEPRIDALSSLLKMEATEEVRIVGIWGMGGIGKTTIARALFNRIAHKFQGSSFVTDVRANSSTKAGMCTLQERILNNIFGAFYGFKIHDPEDGGGVIRRICCSKKVLLVLDDVNGVKQLEFLAATHEWFGPGSRIIITTRDQYLLSYANANDMYKPALLRTDQALELFCMHAFHKSIPPEGYEELSIRAIRYSRGLPLALKVLGSFLSGREASVWKSALDIPIERQIREVFETLKLSFDGLEFEEKELFLNIACFFRGEDIERVTRIHDCFGYHPMIRIRILIEKSLIIVLDNKLDMHDLIQAMGWNIVDECAPNSRLWKVEKVHHFIKNRELEGVKAIMLPNKQYSVHQKLLHFSADVFERLKNLQLLDVSRKFTSCEPTILPRGLRWFSWNQYPFSSLPLADKCDLVGIEMHGGNIEHLWTGRKIMHNLKYLHLQRLDYLTRFPDVSEAPFIERLVLTYCRNLVEVHESLGYHKRLIYVNVSDCRKLNSFPSRIGMDSLETLIISRCSSLERFPEVTIPTVRLSSICLDGCSRIKELPSSIGYLRSLSCLNLARCMSLKNIPNSICELKSLTSLHLDDCVELLTLPEEFGSIEKLEELWLGFTDSFRALQRLPQTINFYSLKNMCSLRKLDLSWRQTEDKGFPEDLHAFSSLEELNLSGNFELTELPASIYHLSNLKHLELNDCYKLQNLHSLPSGLQVLRASGCSSLEMIEDLPEKYEWLYKIWLVGCWKLPDQEDETNPSKLLLLSFLKKCAAVGHRLSIAIPGNKIPSWFKQQRGCDIPIELPPRWHSRVMGFAVSCVFNRMWKNGGDYPVIKFRVVNYGEFVPVSDISSPVSQSQILFADGKKTSISKPQNQMKPHFSEVDYINDTSSAADIDTVWIGYVPFGSFEHMCDDWSGMEGNLAISIKLKTGQLPVRCGAHIVYKEDLESMQQTNSCIADYSKLECVRRVGQSYIYEDKF